MADWTTIPDESLEPGKPIRSVDGLTLRDNPVAIAEGAAGAPRVEDAALSTTATSAGEQWVADRINLNVGEVGTYAFLITTRLGSGGYEHGDTEDGGDLRYSSADNTLGAVVGAGTTWQCMGYAPYNAFVERQVATLWVRIA